MPSRTGTERPAVPMTRCDDTGRTFGALVGRSVALDDVPRQVQDSPAAPHWAAGIGVLIYMAHRPRERSFRVCLFYGGCEWGSLRARRFM